VSLSVIPRLERRLVNLCASARPRCASSRSVADRRSEHNLSTRRQAWIRRSSPRRVCLKVTLAMLSIPFSKFGGCALRIATTELGHEFDAFQDPTGEVRRNCRHLYDSTRPNHSNERRAPRFPRTVPPRGHSRRLSREACGNGSKDRQHSAGPASTSGLRQSCPGNRRRYLVSR
jgi:hypothetical protein